MRLGIISPTGEADGSALQPHSIARGARRIEAAGLDSLWVFDAVARRFMLADLGFGDAILFPPDTSTENLAAIAALRPT
ncbi:MAG: hypothetical protein GY929_06045 [Actinomycetia bacterium]|nr:hypothetical protein [Actinomycetes bacterium]